MGKSKLSLSDAIAHCEEVAEEKEREAEYRQETQGDMFKFLDDLSKSVGGEGIENDALNECLECASEHRQLAEWLRELQKWRALRDSINKLCDVDCEYPQYKESGTMCDACPIGTVKEYFEQIFDGEVNADEDSR